VANARRRKTRPIESNPVAQELPHDARRVTTAKLTARTIA